VPKEVIDRAIGYIRGCQNPDGGFMYMRSQGGISAFSRSAAALAGLYSCGIYDDPAVDRVVQYLMRFCPGGTAEKVEVYYYYGHYYAAMAMWQRGGAVWRQWYPAIRDELCGRQQRLVRSGRTLGYWTDSGISSEFATATALLALQVPLERLPIFQR
ncbi:MAG: prenyltransferase, partial [Planctomycetia bacterium]|nr:prenyltransferase [Planctomycetia bacterium]